MKNVLLALLIIAVSVWMTPALSAEATSPTILLAQAMTPDRAMSDGEVKRVDKDAGKLTIKHGPLANLEMPAMTMVFRVKDPAMLDQVKEGDKIQFVAERANGALTVVELKPAKQ